MQDFEEFGFARRLMRRARKNRTDPRRNRNLQRREALFTYKDLELAAGPRLDRALEILGEGTSLAESGDAEWLGLAGAILKRSWQQRGSSEDLDRARSCYLKGWELTSDPERCHPGINAARWFLQFRGRDSGVTPRGGAMQPDIPLPHSTWLLCAAGRSRGGGWRRVGM